MGALLFDGVNDQLKWTTLASALANASDDGWSVAVLSKLSNLASFRGASYLHSGAGAGTATAGLGYSPSVSRPVTDVGSGIQYDYVWDTLQSVPHFMCASRPSGAGAVECRLSVQLGEAGSVTHHTSGTLANQAAAAQLQIGTWQDSDPWEGHIGVVAWWVGQMSDANKEALTTNWRTSDLWNSAHGRPVFLAELNVAGASVVDIAGNASNLAVVGTSLDSGETMDGWTFDGAGSAGVANISFRNYPKPLLRTRR